MKKIHILITIFLVAIIVSVAAFSQINKARKTNSSPTDSTGNREVVDYTIEMDNFKFSPNVIKAEPGQTIKVKLKSINGSHDFEAPGLNVKSNTLSTGKEQSITISIPADADGKMYEFYCTFHKDMGMTGTIQVEKS
jgi:plastocyanin